VPAPTRGFPETYARYFAPVRAKCRRLLGHSSHADDVAQETFVRFWESGPRVEGAEPRTLMAWLYRTSTRLALDHLRSRRRAGAEPFEDTLPCGANHEDAIAARRMVVEVVAKVDRDELEAAVLCRVDGLSQPEAAGVLGVSERTVRRLLERFDAQTASLRKEIGS
jgi:RNA polymerase sigma-70 factor (ECF subfamily)